MKKRKKIKLYYEESNIKLYYEDCPNVMKMMPDESIDLIVTDPPYGYSFMGKDWDTFNEVVEPQGAYQDKKGFKKLPRNKVGKGFNEFFVPIWKECLRILKSGGFAFVMCAPRQDVLSKQISCLQESGFDMGFTSIYWAYASGFPKAENIGKLIDKKECKKQLTERLGRKPTKEEFKKEWENFRKIIGKKIRGDVQEAKKKGTTFSQAEANRNNKAIFGYGIENLTLPESKEAKKLNGSYGGFQPKPAVEVIIVAMKPLSEKTYVDQALKNKKGITWLDECKIPYEKGDTPQGGYGNMDIGIGKPMEHQKYRKPDSIIAKNPHTLSKGSEAYNNICYGKYNPTTKPIDYTKQTGRFPANLLISNDALNDGRSYKVGDKGKGIDSGGKQTIFGGGLHNTGYGDSGSFSRYFDLDKWWEEKMKKLSNQPCFLCGYIEKHGNYIDNDGRAYCDECLISGDYLDISKLNIEKLPLNAQKTFPFLIVPKASKNEKNKGCENLDKGEVKHYTKNRRCKICGHQQVSGSPCKCKNPEWEIIERPVMKGGNYHPTVKPLKLMSYLIILGSTKGDIVLDPFVGSGTTLLSCKLLNRRGIGIDNKKEYCDIAVARLKATMANLL